MAAVSSLAPRLDISDSLVVRGTPRTWLRLEGAAAAVAGLVVFASMGRNWLLLLPLLILPDLSIAGYAMGPRVGAITYNLVHNWAAGLAVLGAGVAFTAPAVVSAGAVLIAHVGFDRLAGYGLKYPTRFRDTHLGVIGK
jgi:hypothetical protein